MLWDLLWDLIVSFLVGVAVGFAIGFIFGIEVRTLSESGFRRVFALLVTALFAGALYAHVTIPDRNVPTIVFGALSGGIAYYFHTGGTAATSEGSE